MFRCLCRQGIYVNSTLAEKNKGPVVLHNKDRIKIGPHEIFIHSTLGHLIPDSFSSAVATSSVDSILQDITKKAQSQNQDAKKAKNVDWNHDCVTSQALVNEQPSQVVCSFWASSSSSSPSVSSSSSSSSAVSPTHAPSPPSASEIMEAERATNATKRRRDDAESSPISWRLQTTLVPNGFDAMKHEYDRRFPSKDQFDFMVLGTELHVVPKPPKPADHFFGLSSVDLNAFIAFKEVHLHVLRPHLQSILYASVMCNNEMTGLQV